MNNLLLYLLAYLLGAIPFGLVLSLIFAKINIKKLGSGSIGATNVLRVVKKSNAKLAFKLSIATIILDILKAVIPILIAKACGVSIGVQWSMGVLAVLGHCYSPYLKFEGGKGVATACGVMAIFLPLALLCGLVVWAACAKLLKISSLSSLLGLLSFLIASFIIYFNIPVINTHAPVLIISFLIFYKHIPNIKRLFCRSEAAVI